MAPEASAEQALGTLERVRLLDGRVGIVVVAVIPLTALLLFLLFGFLGFWSWSWVFFLLIPLSGVVVYGFRGTEPPVG